MLSCTFTTKSSVSSALAGLVTIFEALEALKYFNWIFLVNPFWGNIHFQDGDAIFKDLLDFISIREGNLH